jgi:hypothetical protein
MQFALFILILLEYPLVVYAHKIDPISLDTNPLYQWVIVGAFLYNSFIIWAFYPKRKDWVNKLFILATLVSFLLIGHWLMTTEGL